MMTAKSKNILIFGFLPFVIFVGSVLPAEAGSTDSKSWFTGAGYQSTWLDIGTDYSPSPSRNRYDAGYVTLGRYFPGNWSVSSVIDFSSSQERTVLLGKQSTQGLGVTARKYTSIADGYRPYLGLGLGLNTFNADMHEIEEEARIEAGFTRSLSRKIDMDFGVRANYLVSEDRVDGDVYLGVVYNFGSMGESTDAAPEPVIQSLSDSDGDGYDDVVDACPHSLRLDVDETGCYSQPAIAHYPDPLNVFFAFGSAQLSKDNADAIDAYIANGDSQRISRLKVRGYTDSVGNAAYNYKLSVMRAASVADYIRERFSIDVRFIDVSGLGESAPISSNFDAKGRAMNRRVEIVID